MDLAPVPVPGPEPELGHARAAPYLERMIAELPNTPCAKAAATHRGDPSSKAPLTCLGCH